MTNYNKYIDNLGTDQKIRKKILKYMKNNVYPWKFVCQGRSDCDIWVIEEVY